MNNSTNFQVNVSTSSAPSTRVPKHFAILIITFTAVSILMGTFGNGRVCILLRRRQDLRKVPHYLLANLAVIGLLSAIIHMPSFIVMTAVNYLQIRQTPGVIDIICKVDISCRPALIVLNALTLSLMAFDRQDCVLRPFTRRLSTSKVKKIIPVTWILACIIAANFAILIHDEPSACVKFYPYQDIKKLTNAFRVHMGVVVQLDTAAFLFITVTFIRIVKELRTPTVGPSLGTDSINERIKKNLTHFALKLFGLFLLSRIPAKIFFILNVAKVVGEFERTVVKTMHLVIFMMSSFAFVANPFVHYNMLQVAPPNQAAARQVVNPVELTARTRENRNATVGP